MIIGMMPPKLVQMMINIAHPSGDFSGIGLYDPFCGLGTTLIEGVNMGISSLYGSDLSPDMVRMSEENLTAFVDEEKLWQDRIKKAGGTPKRDAELIRSQVWQLDATEIVRAREVITDEEKSLRIVSEGYLGEIMSPRDISLDRVQSERRKLARMYDAFFAGITQANLCNTIVMTFPFWNIHGTYSYFAEIYEILERHGWTVSPLLPPAMRLNTTKGSLLYRRDQQTVGREVIKIVRT